MNGNILIEICLVWTKIKAEVSAVVDFSDSKEEAYEMNFATVGQAIRRLQMCCSLGGRIGLTLKVT